MAGQVLKREQTSSTTTTTTTNHPKVDPVLPVLIIIVCISAVWVVAPGRKGLHISAKTAPSSNNTHTHPPEYYWQLHERPAPAIRRGSNDSYPEVQWPLMDETIYPPPTDAELKNTENPFMVVLYYGTFFGKRWPTHRLDCAMPCVLTSNIRKHGKRADVVVFHAPTLDWEAFWAKRKPAKQLWALHSMESEESYTVQQAASPVMKRIDIQATYKMSPILPHLHHIPVTYMNRGEYSDFLLKRPQMYNKTGLALWMHNNCAALSSRQVLVSQLMQIMPVDAPGSCLHNMDSAGLNDTAPLELIASYKFYLVFENVFGDPDWVSSTFFRALSAGTVPVVLGAPNILKFAPGPRSVIRACDFDSLEQLADYLWYLHSNDTAYREYLAWKESDGPSAEFRSLMATSDTSPWCRMCIAAAQQRPEAYDAAHTERLHWFSQMKEAFDVLNAQLDKDSSEKCRGKVNWWDIPLPEDQSFYITHDHHVDGGLLAGDEAAQKLLT